MKRYSLEWGGEESLNSWQNVTLIIMMIIMITKIDQVCSAIYIRASWVWCGVRSFVDGDVACDRHFVESENHHRPSIVTRRQLACFSLRRTLSRYRCQHNSVIKS